MEHASSFRRFISVGIECLSGVKAMRKTSKPMRKTSPKKTSAGTPRMRATSRDAPRFWSADVTRRSNALDLQQGVFTLKDPKRIAASLKRSAEASRRKKTDSYRSALSMLSFYINRAGTNLPATRRRILIRAKGELRKQFGRA